MSPPLGARWEQIGRLPALPVVAVTYGVLFVAVLAVGDPARRVAGGVVVAALAVQCLARPARGWSVFFLAGLPALTGTLLDDIITLPRWTGLCFLPFALVLAWFVDHPDD